MPPAFSTTLPGDEERMEDIASPKRSAHEPSMFSNASGPVQINDGVFSALNGSQYGRVKIVINQGGPRKMKPIAGNKRPSGYSRSTSSSVPQADPDTTQSPVVSQDLDVRRLGELVEQISKWKEMGRLLDSREAELNSLQHVLDEREANITFHERRLQEMETCLRSREAEVDERERELDDVERRLSTMKENLLWREGLMKEAIEDLRDREKVFEKHTSSQYEQPPTSSSTARQLPSIPTPHRRQAAALEYAESSPTTFEEPRTVKVVHRRPLPQPVLIAQSSKQDGQDLVVVDLTRGPNITKVLHKRRPLPVQPRPPHAPGTIRRPLPPSPAVVGRCYADQGECAREAEGTQSDQESNSWSLDDDDLLLLVDSEDDCESEQASLESEALPRYSESPEPFQDQLKSKVAEQLHSSLESLGVSKGTPAAFTQSECKSAPLRMSIIADLLRDHVEDIVFIESRVERADAIVWAIDMLVETGKIDPDSICTLCNRVSEDEQSASIAVRALKRALQRRHLTLVQLYALRLLRLMLTKASSAFRDECLSPHFMETMENIVYSDDTNPAVRARTREAIAAIRNGQVGAHHPLSLRHIETRKGLLEGPAFPTHCGLAY